MVKQTVNVGTLANDRTGDTLRDAFIKVNENFLVPTIDSNIIGTVAAEGDPAGVNDFDTFDEAMVYVEAQRTGDYTITLLLNLGTHYIGENKHYSFDNVNLEIESSDFWTSVMITLHPNSVSSGTAVITLNDNCNFDFEALIFDDTDGGYAFANVADCLRVNESSKLNCVGVDIYGFDNAVYLYNGYASMRAFVNDNWVSGSNTSFRAVGRDAYLDMTYSGGTYMWIQSPAHVSKGGQVILAGFNEISQANLPLNAIDIDGSVVVHEYSGVPYHYGGFQQLIWYSISKTVGVGRDFTTLDDAMDWVSNQITTAQGKITLNLRWGETHEINNSYYNIDRVNLVIKGEAPQLGASIVTNKATAWSGARTLFTVGSDATLSLEDFVYDPELLGWTHSTGVTFIAQKKHSRVYIDGMTISNISLFVNSGGGYTQLDGNVTLDSAAYGLYLSNSAEVRLRSVFTMTNVTRDIEFYSSGGANGDCTIRNYWGASLTYDYCNIPVNEVQTNGNFFQDHAFTPLIYNAGTF